MPQKAHPLVPHFTPSTFNVVSGDKGGVGKSFSALALIDYLTSKGLEVVVFEADKSNPDVARMYQNNLKCYYVDLTTENGWMEVMDAVAVHPAATFVMSMPAGIGSAMKIHLPGFQKFIARREIAIDMVLWWVMNPQHDSVNLLAEACNTYGRHFPKNRVICNTHFSDGNQSAFFLWHDSPLRHKMEKDGAATMYLPGLSLRVVAKLFDPRKIMPFSDAIDIALGEQVEFTESERHKLEVWRENVSEIFDTVYPWPAAPATKASGKATDAKA
ncbi:MAG: hypothetical protein J0I91_18785 [Candidatus Accumulibacter sp.]|nr:hypothetical protein [Accumulibacter sp.]